jgi:hypothetical protein
MIKEFSRKGEFMSICRGVFLFILFMFFPIYTHSENYMDDKKPLTIPVATEESRGKSNLTAPETATKTEAVTAAETGQKTQSQGQIKAQSICIGEDCRSKWPSLKCENYDGRPAGETGDEFCGQMNKTCIAVSIGSGQSFFGECSVAANSVHKCRCCWVE